MTQRRCRWPVRANGMQSRWLSPFVFALLGVSLSGLTSGCQRVEAPVVHEVTFAPLDRMPARVQSARTEVQQAYRFAFANPDLLKQIPCYCGCSLYGHDSNYPCYVSGTDASGAAIYDPHALDCNICVDITQDAIRMTREGRSPAEIRAYVDDHYSQYGASNMPNR